MYVMMGCFSFPYAWLTDSRVAAVILALHMGTGQSFSSAYGPTFYKTVGLSSKAFLYTVSI
jgi:hypothetical protein